MFFVLKDDFKYYVDEHYAFKSLSTCGSNTVHLLIQSSYILTCSYLGGVT